MNDNMEINPNWLEELQTLLQDVSYEIHYTGDADKEYDYLEEEEICITVLNPYQEKKLYIDLSEDFTLTYGAFHCHYIQELYDYKAMAADIQGILKNELCSAALYCGGEREWMGSTCAAKAALSQPIQETFRFVFKLAECKEKLIKYGGEAEFHFWNPADDGVIEFPKGAAVCVMRI